ncbi:MAG: serine/threonine protein phosphatase [Oscillospiraceae bacterium]|nr:serine/threonine protein phosphatase [Oscillospiraceae bacterium]
MIPDKLLLRRLDNAFRYARVIEYTPDTKIVIFSDCHRGTGDYNDLFAQNHNIYYDAVRQYFNYGYTYIDLGDSADLWLNRKIEPIIEEYTNIYELLNEYYNEGRYIVVHGNPEQPLFPGLQVHESVILRDSYGNEIYMTHGHQVDPISSVFWRLGEFLVRYMWRPLESLGIKQPMGTAEHRMKKKETEPRLIEWCKQRGKALIAGHTHRVRFPKDGEPEYYNVGSGVRPRAVTAIEIERSGISLVKWSVESRDDGTLCIAKTVIDSRTVSLR